MLRFVAVLVLFVLGVLLQESGHPMFATLFGFLAGWNFVEVIKGWRRR